MARISTPRRLAGSLLVLTLVAAACGGDDDAADDVADDAAEQIEEVLGGTLPGGATLPDDVEDILDDVTLPDDLTDVTLPDDLSDITLPDDLSDITLPGGVTLPEDITDLTVPDMPASGDGSCTVDVTGDVTTSWSQDQNVGSVLVSEWFTETEREMLGDSFSILLNCVGDGDDSLSALTTGVATADNVPQAPGTYELTGGAGMFGGEGDLWSLLLSLDGTDTNWSVAEPGGTLTVTEFDDDSIKIEIDATPVRLSRQHGGGRRSRVRTSRHRSASLAADTSFGAAVSA
jgi:hypothetical protein